MANSGLASTAGSTFIGVLLGLILYGCSCAQIVIYFRRYSEDPLGLKALAATLWALDTIRSAMDSAFTWHLLVASHAAPAKLAVGTSTFMMEFFFASLSILVVQCYYIHVVWKLMKDRWYKIPLTVTSTLTAFASFSGGVGIVGVVGHNPLFSVAIPASVAPATLETLAAFATDAYITISLCVILRGRRTGIRKTENVIATLVIYAINRGIFTALFQLAHFITYICFRTQLSFWWMIAHVPGTALYVNSLLALLNVRQNLRGQMAGPEHVSMTLRNHERLPGNDGTLPGPKIALKFAH